MNDNEKQQAVAPFRLGILMATWGRPILTAHALYHYAGIQHPKMELVKTVVWSKDDPTALPVVKGWDYVEAPNQPLGRKWNTGLRSLIAKNVDAVMIIGSDDFISWRYFGYIYDQLRMGADVISVRDLYVYQPGDDYVAFCESMVPGAGRTISVAAVRLLKSRLWDDDATGYLDSSIMQRIRQVSTLRHYNMRDMGARGFAILDVKTKDGPNMWSLVQIGPNRYALENEVGARLNIRRVTKVPAAQFFRDHFPHIVKYKELGAADPYA